jgi:hypothetical protein
MNESVYAMCITRPSDCFHDGDISKGAERFLIQYSGRFFILSVHELLPGAPA